MFVLEERDFNNESEETDSPPKSKAKASEKPVSEKIPESTLPNEVQVWHTIDIIHCRWGLKFFISEESLQAHFQHEVKERRFCCLCLYLRLT